MMEAWFIAFLVVVAIVSFLRGRRDKCRLYGHDWGDRRRSRPVLRGPIWVATLVATCQRCDEEVREERWAFMKGAGALSWICGGDAIDIPAHRTDVPDAIRWPAMSEHPEAIAERKRRQDVLKMSLLRDHGCEAPGIASEMFGLGDSLVITCRCGAQAEVTSKALASV